MKKLKIKQSLFVKVLSSILGALLVIIVAMELYNIYILNLYRSKAEDNYSNSLKLYSEYWDAKLEIINNSLIIVMNEEYDTSYRNLCYATDTLTLETSKVQMLRKLEEMARTHNQQIYTFCYIPDRDIYISCSKNLTEFSGMRALDGEIRNAVSDHTFNDNVWKMIEVDDHYYLMQIFFEENGYLGSVLSCDTILDSLMEDEELISAAAFLNAESMPVYQIGTDEDFQLSSSVFSQSLKMSDYRIGIHTSQNTTFSDTTLFTLSVCGILVMGFIFAASNITMQHRIVLKPLNKLKDAMLRFSFGELSTRLEEKSTTEEINTLYTTFNEMAEQITDLKIDVYEAELEKKEIRSSFLQLQIQPHFYTNILNLIYRLAEAGQNQSIQKIALVTSRYFRFLLNNKNELISLDREISCIQDYVEIQKIRYPGLLSFQINIGISAEEYLVPPLILQTFVENSIMHNITFVSILKVSVAISENEKKLIMEITDNGLGFKQEIREQLNEGKSISENGKHIGIINVKQRLKLLYDDRADVLIDQKDKITIIRIELPKTKMEEEILDESAIS